MKQPAYILRTLGAALLLVATACSQEDSMSESGRLPGAGDPMIFQATGLGQIAATPASRSTVDNDWEGVPTVAVLLNNETKAYTVKASEDLLTAQLTSEDPFHWTSTDPVVVSAWWPYSDGNGDGVPDGTMPPVVVKADQSTPEGYAQSDFIAAEAQSISPTSPILTFSHRTAHIKVRSGLSTPIVSMQAINLATTDGNPAEIEMYHNEAGYFEALVAPQSLSTGANFLKFTLSDGTIYLYKLQNAATFKAGSDYEFAIVADSEYNEETNTYTVYTVKGLQEWATAAQADLSTNCILGADITLPAPEEGQQSNWTVIGSDATPYTGTFDGANFSIGNLTIVASSSFQGLFGEISNGAVLNLNLKDVDISGNGYFGGIAGQADNATIANCTVSGKIAGSGSNIGGIVGKSINSTRIFGCQVANCEFSGGSTVGGVVGSNEGTIVACSASSNLSTNGASGGITGPNTGSIISCCFSGNVSVAGLSKRGAIASSNSNTVTACYWDTFEGSAIGGNDSQAGTTKVDGTDVTWATAIEAMNTAIETWNASNTENPCNYRFTAGEDGRPVIE